MFSKIVYVGWGGSSVSNSNGSSGLPSYSEGQTYHTEIRHDLDAGSYQIRIDGDLRVTRPHGISDRGIGRIIVWTVSDSNLVGMLYIDNLIVTQQ